MTPVMAGPQQSTETASFPWTTIAWVAALLAICYGPILSALVSQWNWDPDMGHGFFVPVIAGYIAWQKRTEILSQPAKPNWWGLAVMGWGALQLYIATLGAEIFLARTSFVVTVIGTVLLLGGTQYLKTFAFPLFLLFFMVPIPAIIYNEITFPLQLIASSAAENAIGWLGVPVIREGNVLVLANTSLNVVEACSGIRSLLTLTFLSLVYGYFLERRLWLRIVLFFSTIPIAVIANAGRVTLTGVVASYKADLAEGSFHEAQGWVIFMVALVILIAFHQAVLAVLRLTEKKHPEAAAI
jgi:exosortase